MLRNQHNRICYAPKLCVPIRERESIYRPSHGVVFVRPQIFRSYHHISSIDSPSAPMRRGFFFSRDLLSGTRTYPAKKQAFYGRNSHFLSAKDAIRGRDCAVRRTVSRRLCRLCLKPPVSSQQRDLDSNNSFCHIRYLLANLKNVCIFGWDGSMHNATEIGGAIGLLVALIQQAFTVSTLPIKNPAQESFFS